MRGGVRREHTPDAWLSTAVRSEPRPYGISQMLPGWERPSQAARVGERRELSTICVLGPKWHHAIGQHRRTLPTRHHSRRPFPTNLPAEMRCLGCCRVEGESRCTEVKGSGGPKVSQPCAKVATVLNRDLSELLCQRLPREVTEYDLLQGQCPLACPHPGDCGG